MMVDRSIKSAVIVILCAAVTFVFSLWLFEGKKSVKGYLSANFYALLELCRFAWYAFCIPVLHQMSAIVSAKAAEGNVSFERVNLWLLTAEVVWNFLMGAGNCILLYLVISCTAAPLRGLRKSVPGRSFCFWPFPVLRDLFSAFF